MKRLVQLCLLSLVVVSCERSDHDKTVVTPEEQYQRDNTGRNVRDRNADMKTSGDQLENETDRALTQRIRQALVADDRLSTNGKNIKVISINGVITLRGPVANIQEKEIIIAKVREVKGVNKIENQLEAK